MARRPPSASDAAARAPYEPPRVERLGTWSALTLQQSIPISGDAFTSIGPS